MKKRCSYCRKNKPLDNFWKNKAKVDGKQTICRECQTYITKKYYKKNKKKHAKVVRDLKRVKVKFLKQALKDYLLRHPCVDCRERDINVLEFDHIDETLKSNSISRMIGGGYPWEKILKEIEKCVVRCSNCHRRRTFKQFGWKRA